MEAPAQGGDAGNVAVPDGRHCHHEEVDALPVGQLLAVEEVVPGVARVLQLLVEGRQERMDSGGKEERERWKQRVSEERNEAWLPDGYSRIFRS